MNLRILHAAALIIVLAANRLAAAEGTNSVPEQPARTTNQTGRLDSSSFRNIYEHNIFDPNRRGAIISEPRPRPVQVDTFALRGTMSYPDHSIAFFDGNSVQYNRAVTTKDMIAGYKVAEIAFDHVKLMAASNQTVNLPVGSQMKRRDNGPWSLEENAEPAADDTPPAATNSSGRPGETERKPGEMDRPGQGRQPAHAGVIDNDVIQRLMKKRQQDN
jgi:hypothetical protein